METTIYLKQKKSGNYFISDKNDFDVKLTAKTVNEWAKLHLLGWYDYTLRKYFGNRVIKSTYSRSQKYYSTQEFINLF